MEEELNYVTVTFKTKSISTHEKPNRTETVYDTVKTEEQEWNPVAPEKVKKAPVYTLLHVVAVSLGIICVILVSAVIALSIHLNTVMSEWNRNNISLTAQNLLLQHKKTNLERQKEELTKVKDGLNWTIGVILEYETFSVKTQCPQKVCKPCLDNWVWFQSSCYLFSNYYLRSWQRSLDTCRQIHADLVVIESQEEQEFINNHTSAYHDKNNGYWIGLSKNEMDTWKWVDGRSLNMTYWKTQEAGNKGSCALSLPSADPLASWDKVGCDSRNRWICETRALIKSD
uniref:C-type lectin domain-containing protein n=1 Tax=Monopterus albus TaxID=43700 RepID=A0A3Q3IND2_MONAL|nr:C-type lectin domain family 4 member M-like [Monopterus albus]